MVHKPEAQASGKPGILAVHSIACASGLSFGAKPLGRQEELPHTLNSKMDAGPSGLRRNKMAACLKPFR
jgi:hypothetical protein